MCTVWPGRGQPCPESHAWRGLASDCLILYHLNHLLILSSIFWKKNLCGEAERRSLCYIGQSLGILPLLTFLQWCRPCLAELGQFRVSAASRQKASCPGRLQGAVHQAGTFSAGQVWGLAGLDEGAGSALRSEHWWPGWHWGDLGPLWKLDPAALLNCQNTNPGMKPLQHLTFCSFRGAIGFVLKSIFLLNCQLFSHCLLSLMFYLVISFFSVLSTYNIVLV